MKFATRRHSKNSNWLHKAVIIALSLSVIAVTSRYAVGVDRTTVRRRPNFAIDSSWDDIKDVGRQTTPFPTNFWFVKTIKTGGTTLSGVFAAIASHYGILGIDYVNPYMKQGVMPPVDIQFEENRQAGKAAAKYIAMMNHRSYNATIMKLFRGPTLLFTSVRHPLSRFYSSFQQTFCVSRNSSRVFFKECEYDTLEHRKEFAYRNENQNHLFKYISKGNPAVQDVIKQYDFIFVTERMNEALVLFKIEYGLEWEDITYLTAKNRTGLYETHEQMPEELNQYILENNKLDIELWEAANQRLDERRDKLEAEYGRETVGRMMELFEHLLRAVREQCSDYETWYRDHGFGPPFTFALIDWGIGHRCVRHVTRQLLNTANRPTIGLQVGSKCPTTDRVTPFPSDFWFVKTGKTGGSTLSGMFSTISAHYGIISLSDIGTEPAEPVFEDMRRARKRDTECLALLNHRRFNSTVLDLFAGPTLLFTTVRHPLPRFYSNFIQRFCVSNETLSEKCSYDTLEHREQFARSDDMQNHLFKYIKGDLNNVQDVVDRFDFIFVTERMNEALVLFKIEYGLEWEDITYLTAKNRTGLYETHEQMPEELNQYILENNKLDIELWEAANQRLDERRAKLEAECGGEAIQQMMEFFERLQTEVRQQCSDYTTWYQDHGFLASYAYKQDWGVGYSYWAGSRSKIQ